MPITTLDRATALVVIDIQKGVARIPTAHPSAGVIDNCVRLVDAFRAKSKPVVLVRAGFAADSGDALKARTQTPFPAGKRDADFFEYVDALRADPARDILIHKRQWGAFYGTDLDLQLRRRGITNIVLCGIATGYGVESTARDAWEHGYNLTFATDAMTDMNLDVHDRALQFVFPRIGELGTTDEVAAKL
ncbi:MAG TPA: isochorismatase family protein [Candidatus Baltobacteraceae bacterium]